MVLMPHLSRSGRGPGRPALHGPEPSQSARPCAEADARRLPRHDLRRHRCKGRETSQGIPSQMAAEMQGRRRQPQGGRDQAVHLCPARPATMEIGEDNERDRAVELRIPPPHHDPDRAALRQNRADAALGPDRLRPDQTARRVTSAQIDAGALTSESSRAPLVLAFPATLAGRWMPGLFPDQ